MRVIIQDKVSHQFIEGPTQSNTANSNLYQGSAEREAHNTDLLQGYEDEDLSVSIYDSKNPNERYD